MKAKIIKGKFKKLSFKIQEESEFKKKKKLFFTWPTF